MQEGFAFKKLKSKFNKKFMQLIRFGSENPEFRDLFIIDHKLEGLKVLRKVSNNSNIPIIYETRNSEIVLEEIISQKMRAYFSNKQSQSK